MNWEQSLVSSGALFHCSYDCSIDFLPGASLHSSWLYNHSWPEQEGMEKCIRESLATGLICPSSPVGRGVFFVQKNDGSLQPCTDCRALNDITSKNKYPLPLLDVAFGPLHKARILSKLDLYNVYHLVQICKGDEWSTAFNTPLGHFKYLVMPFGLTNAPAMFQSLVNDVLRDMLNKFLFIYLGDIISLRQRGNMFSMPNSPAPLGKQTLCQAREMSLLHIFNNFPGIHSMIQ